MEEVNLFPIDIIEKRSRVHRIQVWCMVGAGVVIVLCILSALLGHRIEEAQSRLDDLSVRYRHMESLIMKIRALDTEMKVLEEKEKIIDSLLEGVPWAETLRTLAVSAEDDVWFTSLEMIEVHLATHHDDQSAQEAKAHGADARGDDENAELEGREAIEISLSGYAISNAELAAFLSRLSVSGFSQVDLRESRQAWFSDYAVVEFEMNTLLE